MKVFDVCRIPVIGRILENKKAEKNATEILKKYQFYKTEDSVQKTLDRNMALYRERKEKIIGVKYFFSYVFLMPLSKIFKLISFLSRIGLFISIFTFFIGGYKLYKCISGSGNVDVMQMIAYLVAPFVLAFASYLFSMIADKCWKD